MQKIKTIVNIGGKEYTICGTDSEDYMHRVAIKVNGKLDEIKKANPNLNNVELVMLTCINLADEYMKTADELALTRRELSALKQQYGMAEKERKQAETAPPAPQTLPPNAKPSANSARSVLYRGRNADN